MCFSNLRVHVSDTGSFFCVALAHPLSVTSLCTTVSPRLHNRSLYMEGGPVTCHFVIARRGSGERDLIAEAPRPVRYCVGWRPHLSRLGVFRTNPVQANFAGFFLFLLPFFPPHFPGGGQATQELPCFLPWAPFLGSLPVHPYPILKSPRGSQRKRSSMTPATSPVCLT